MHDLTQRSGRYRQRISSHIMSSSIMLDTGPKTAGKSCAELEVRVACPLCIMSWGWPRSLGWSQRHSKVNFNFCCSKHFTKYAVIALTIVTLHAVLSNSVWHVAVRRWWVDRNVNGFGCVGIPDRIWIDGGIPILSQSYRTWIVCTIYLSRFITTCKSVTQDTFRHPIHQTQT